MNLLKYLSVLFAVSYVSAQPTATPAPVVDDPVVLRAGEFALTKAEYEKLVIGFDRGSGAVATGANPQTAQSAQDVARLLALVSAAKARQIDQDPVVAAEIRVRGYVLLANNLLVKLREDMKRDEAGTRALWASEKHNFVEIRARHILVRYEGVTAKPGSKGTDRTEARAKERAAALCQKLKAGSDFAVLARTESDDETTTATGGELPVFTRGAMTAEFETIAFGLPAGKTSEPFKTQYGYHIVQMIEHRPMPFEKVRAALEDMRARKLYEEIATSGIQLSDTYFKE